MCRKNVLQFGCLFAVALIAVGLINSSGKAAGVSFFGAEIDGTAAEWRTPAVAKPNDLDGDNIYGTEGGVHWGIIGKNQNIFWAFNGSGTQVTTVPGYSDVDDLSIDNGTDANGNIALDFFEFTVLQASAVVRVGVMHDVLTPAEYAADFGWSGKITQTAGAGTGNTVTSSILPVGNGIVDMVFFDLTDVAAGDKFKIEGVSNNGRTQNPYLAPVSFDALGALPPPPIVPPDFVSLISVDIQAVGGNINANPTPPLMNGPDPRTGLGNVWNEFAVPGHDGVAVNPSVSGLVDSEGNTTSVGFQMFGTLSGWSNSPVIDVLTGDYVFVQAGNSDVGSNWEITGLNPGDEYNLYLYGGISRTGPITVDVNGNGLLDELAQNAPIDGVLLVEGITVGANGKIIGDLQGNGSEKNWSGFQLLKPVPEPAAWILMALCIPCLGLYRWRRNR